MPVFGTVFLLNLPKKVSKGTGSLEYVYDAAGNKLAKKLNGAFINFYCGSVVYTGGKAVEYVAHSEGIAHKSGSAFAYQYNQTDHLGNVCSVADASKTVVQATDYFPFGLAHSTTVASLAKNKYLYNGKELQNDVVGTSFGQLDYGARMYDATLGVWHSIDPLAEKSRRWSPYTYCYNNPMRFIDPDGRSVDPASLAEWDRQKQAIVTLKDGLQGKIDNLNTKAAEKGWSAEKLERKIGSMQERVNLLNSSINNLGVLEQSRQVYSLNSGANTNNLVYDPGTGNIVINYNGTALFTHETTHAGQFEIGDVAFDRNNGTSYGQDVFDEVAAFRSQWGYDPSTVNGFNSSGSITSNFIQNIAINGAKPYAPGGENNTGVSPVNINSTKNDLIRAYPHQRGLLGLPANATLRTLVPIYLKQGL